MGSENFGRAMSVEYAEDFRNYMNRRNDTGASMDGIRQQDVFNTCLRENLCNLVLCQYCYVFNKSRSEECESCGKRLRCGACGALLKDACYCSVCKRIVQIY